MHGQYPERVGKPDINQVSTHQWLRNYGLKAETEGFIIAAQDQSLPTKIYQNRIIKMAQIQNAECVTTVMKV